ncbi:type II toxin-antitoxin system PemK/MazF family toxin [Levilactobacillus andaensis]|uniref:type II toxin-antitoxin system PemK/MazF family toxin n=1 Tax=Levilactobacillus andaensis TaxID=2799570 RepID=UPI001943F072|nr:type II toxin-antitoxin system PemK/MazF family toxin [Levilactobacillus andaensis]
MTELLMQRDIVYVTFDPSVGHEIQKRRPALVMSRNEYNLSTNFIIVCPITSTPHHRPFLIPLVEPVQKNILRHGSQVNTAQVYSLDSHSVSREIKKIGHLNQREFLKIAQYFSLNFNFPF